MSRNLFVPPVIRGRTAGIICAFLWMCILACYSIAELRTWTSRSGAQVKASFERMDENTVVLKRDSNAFTKIQLNQLSQKDQDYVLQTTGRKGSSLDDLQKETPLPVWAKPVKVVPEAGKPWKLTDGSGRSVAGMKQSVGRLQYVVENHAKSDEYPFYLFQLARHYTELNEDGHAYRAFKRLASLPNNTPFRAMGAYPNLSMLKDHGRIITARIVARNGLIQEAGTLMKGRRANSGPEVIRQAEIMALLGNDAQMARLVEKPRFDSLFLYLRAVVLLRTTGQNPLAVKIAEPLLKSKLKDQPGRQWQSALAIMRMAADNARTGRNPTFSGLRDGTYKAACRGFDAPVEVEVRVADRRASEIKVTQQGESRPWSALEIIPARIIKRQSLNVDAITGATVSSCAVIAAVDKAIMQSPRQ